MKKQLDCILLVDDDDACNFFHKRLINSKQYAAQMQTARNGLIALNYLNDAIAGKQVLPNLILLDINMPLVNGWDFLAEYEKLPADVKSQMVIVMVSSSINPDDEKRAMGIKSVAGFVQKFLDEDSLHGIITQHFAALV
jgi:CheY-like chemotaxis protein